MPQILVEQLAKRYSVAERDPGLAGAVRGLPDLGDTLLEMFQIHGSKVPREGTRDECAPTQKERRCSHV